MDWVRDLSCLVITKWCFGVDAIEFFGLIIVLAIIRECSRSQRTSTVLLRYVPGMIRVVKPTLLWNDTVERKRRGGTTYCSESTFSEGARRLVL